LMKTSLAYKISIQQHPKVIDGVLKLAEGEFGYFGQGCPRLCPLDMISKLKYVNTDLDDPVIVWWRLWN